VAFEFEYQDIRKTCQNGGKVMFTVLVCGGRDYTDADKVSNVLCDLCDKHGLWDRASSAAHRWVRKDALRVIGGATSGADSCALQWALLNGADLKIYMPEYDKYPAYSAPAIRNVDVFENEKMDLVLVFALDSNAGDIIRLARKARIEVRIIK